MNLPAVFTFASATTIKAYEPNYDFISSAHYERVVAGTYRPSPIRFSATIERL